MSSQKLYPNYDMSVWLRTCKEEIDEPLEGKVKGIFPSWLQGSLIRNGPGCFKIGSSRYKHFFDGLALIHRFAIKDGKVTYQCRFVRSETFKRNKAANRIVVTEFGTRAAPDPCNTIFDRISSIFTVDTSDNTGVTVYPFGDQIYALTEVPVMYRINPKTLETMDRRDDSLLVFHTAHPHVMSNGDVYNVGVNNVMGILKYGIVKFPYTDKGNVFDLAEIVCRAKLRWNFNPSYMHSFGITDNYFLLVEQPLVISIVKHIRRYVVSDSIDSTLMDYPEYGTDIIVINRKTGVERRYSIEAIYFFHIINTFECDGKLMVDVCYYKDGKMVDAMYIKAMEDMQSNTDYSRWFDSRPLRLEVPLDESTSEVRMRLLADVGVEVPTINYKLCNGKPYRYFYGIAADFDKEHAGSIVKVDTYTGKYLMWREHQSYPSEPVFIARPDAQDEDDGVLLSAVLWGDDDRAITLLVLNAKNLQEIARSHFKTPSQTTKCIHGWFFPG